jgi:hypothetical protein
MIAHPRRASPARSSRRIWDPAFLARRLPALIDAYVRAVDDWSGDPRDEDLFLVLYYAQNDLVPVLAQTMPEGFLHRGMRYKVRDGRVSLDPSSGGNSPPPSGSGRGV